MMKTAGYQRFHTLAQALIGATALFGVQTCLSAEVATDSPPEERWQIGVNQKRIEEHVLTLATYGRDAKGATSRVAYSDADLAGRDYVKSLMRNADLSVYIDAAGNMIGTREGKDPTLKPIMMGSHIDTVPEGGNYDGVVGSIGAIEVAQTLSEKRLSLRHPLNVIVFANEEGALVGSRAIVGRMTRQALGEMSQSGFRHHDGIVRLGGAPDDLDGPLYQQGDLAAFLELHIEQGDILHGQDLDIGIVEGIVGIRWWNVTVKGHANHAGTTRMAVRRDALLSAARLIVAVNDVALETDGRQVATVGRISAEPGAPNVVPGIARLSLEIRDLDVDRMQRVYDAISMRAKEIAADSGTTIDFAELNLGAKPVLTDTRIRNTIATVAGKLDLSTLLMPSGAGHDAQEMSSIVPTGMIFVPSANGVSHSPEEYTSPADMANGANTLLHTILELDRQATEAL